ncbi:glycoside hydrolase family 3 C-terminal domain-containing protein [Granulicella arctica]|uniref:Beta-glucosidase n=1 Tax=Granulicella arctica TaxID=940613 RepID=A0A7Y9PFK4_9BACT|nr:glycoside hydrolase family 3 C-terminal domain-containing protein [Granulicella arctica]NYF79013.1 beta-glucosidase [Granulicella arctica]
MKPVVILSTILLCVCSASAQDAARPAYLDPSKPTEQRVADLISRMTLEEKAQQLNHLNGGIPRLKVPAWGGWNQTLHGVWSKQSTTLFPAPIAMGATWDAPLIRTITSAMSDEARALYNLGADGPRSKHGLVFRSPVINVSRDPRWGRIQEVFSEDPFLTGRMGVAYIQGLQGDDPHYLKVAATVKHFAVNNVETNRQRLSAEVDERNLMEYWLPHWKAAIMEGHAQSVMASYNAINGTPDAVNRYLLTDILRGQWHFDGFVTDDLGGVNLLVTAHHITEDPVEATVRAIQAGCDSDDIQFETNIPLAVKSGRLPIAEVDRALGRVLGVGFRLGAFDPPEMNPYSKISADVIRSDEHLHLSLQTALESMTLLSNKGNFLPLNKERLKSVAVIGPAGDTDYETGNYYGKPARKVGPLQGLKEALGPRVKVEYEQGAGFIEAADPAAIARAVELARRSDVAILFLGTNLKVEAEGKDRRDLNLPGAQEKLMEAVYAANPKTVLVLMNAGPLAVTWANDHLPAILDAWYPGEAGGTAIAQVLLGEYNPGGHLPYTVYASLDGVPPQNEYDVSKGYTYLYFKGVPLYPFGHGLSYTQFKFSNLKLSHPTINATGQIEVSFDLQNIGSMAGSEVVQMYVHQVKSDIVQPIKSLRGFQRVVLEPGETRHMTIPLDAPQLSYYDVVTRKFIVAPGMFDVMVGASSEDIRLRTLLEVNHR